MLNINDLNQIYLGIQGENGARPITIDVRPWLISHPSGCVSIWHTRNGETTPQPTGAIFDSEAGTVTWTPASVDTYVFGEGEAEIRLDENGVIKKTRKIKTYVSPSVTGSDGAGEAMDSDWQEYLNAIARAAQVAVIKGGHIKFEIEDGHLYFCYTDEVPVEGEGEEEEGTENPTWFRQDLGSVMVDISGKKDKQTPVTDPTASGTALTFIATLSQDANGNITPEKKQVSAMQGATLADAGAAGLVPAPSAGDNEKYLRGDGTWAEGGGGGNATVLRCDMGTITSLPVTKAFSDVTENMTVIYYESDNMQAFSGDLTVTTDDGYITVDGTILTGKEATLTLTLSTTNDVEED